VTGRARGARILSAVAFLSLTGACASARTYLDPAGPVYDGGSPAGGPARRTLRVVAFKLKWGRHVDRAVDLLTRPGPLSDPGHRVPALASLRNRYDAAGGGTELASASLGLAGSVGFLLLLATNLWPRKQRIPRFLAESNLVLLLLGTVGGFGALFALLVTPLLRGYTRVSVFLGFLAVAAVARALERVLEHLRPARAWVGAAWAAALLLALFDQTSASLVPDHARLRAAFAGDAAFARRMEAALRPNGVVFVLPYMPFPEAAGPISPSDLLRSYLHTSTLRYSAGAMAGRYAALWQEDVSRRPPGDLVETLVLAGFDAVLVDRRGLGSSGSVEEELGRLLGPPLQSDDATLGCYLLRPVADRLRGSPAWPGRAAVTERVLVAWSGFFAEERDGERAWRWCSAGA
jgi:phosphoglycerol transferase